MNIDEFKTALSQSEDDVLFCRQHLFSEDVWILNSRNFDNPNEVYDEVKSYFSRRLGIQKADVAIVGSAKTGFSLSPRNAFRAFDTEYSDIDVVLVDVNLFSRFWRELFHLFYSATYVKSEYQKDVFLKFVTMERDIDLPSSVIRDWHKTMDNLKRDFFTQFRISSPIKYRIYESWEAVELYHASGLRKIRKSLREMELDSTE